MPYIFKKNYANTTYFFVIFNKCIQFNQNHLCKCINSEDDPLESSSDIIILSIGTLSNILNAKK